MATPFFGKREPETPSTPSTNHLRQNASGAYGNGASSTLQSGSSSASQQAAPRPAETFSAAGTMPEGGNLTVRQKLVIYTTGKVTGKIRYGKLVIEEGGQLSGEIMFGAVTTGSKPNGVSNTIKPELQQVA